MRQRKSNKYQIQFSLVIYCCCGFTCSCVIITNNMTINTIKFFYWSKKCMILWNILVYFPSITAKFEIFKYFQAFLACVVKYYRQKTLHRVHLSLVNKNCTTSGMISWERVLAFTTAVLLTDRWRKCWFLHRRKTSKNEPLLWMSRDINDDLCTMINKSDWRSMSERAHCFYFYFY